MSEPNCCYMCIYSEWDYEKSNWYCTLSRKEFDFSDGTCQKFVKAW